MSMTPAEFAEALRRTRGNLGTVVKGPLVATMLDAEREAKLNATGRVLNRRTGNLAQSIAGTIEQREAGMPVGVLRAGGRVRGDSVRYAVAQERGATIRPRRAKMLRIPLPAALTGAGVDRHATPLRQTAPDQFFLVKSKAGNLLLFNKATRTPWYVLKRESRIPARPFLRPALEGVAPRLEGRIIASLRKVIASGGTA